MQNNNLNNRSNNNQFNKRRNRNLREINQKINNNIKFNRFKNRYNRNPGFRYRFNFIRNPNNYQRKNRKFQNNTRANINKSIRDITQLIKKTSLTGGPLKNTNTKNKKNMNDPNMIRKEIRYDKLYNAFEMYNMGKYYSFYKTTNMIIRIAIYSTYNIVFNANNNCSFIWLPYAYPFLDGRFIITHNDSQHVADSYCDFFWSEHASTMNIPSSTRSSIPGNYRLIAASLKISNITTNSLKGGSYTVYRISKNDLQPIYYNKDEDVDSYEDVYSIARRMMEFENYENEPIKYLYNANQVCQCNEYGVIQGNDIFQDCTEYMGSRTSLISSTQTGTIGGDVNNFNPNGVNIKYVGKFDGTTTQQSYKIQSIKIFEVTPDSNNSFSAAAFKGSKSVTPNVIMQAKNKFNLECIDA
jgi:hypothetical protein